MKQVFVETNWIVDCFAPAHQRTPFAVHLLDQARAGAIQLRVPAPCITEARAVIRKKFQPKEANRLREYLKWAKANGLLGADDDASARRVLDQFESRVNSHLDTLQGSLAGLSGEVGVEVFPLNADMLESSLTLSAENLELKPYDSCVLAAVLTRARELAAAGEKEVFFCELDGDLQPWSKDGQQKPTLVRLYDEAHVWVYRDFTMTRPEPRDGW